LHALSRLHAWNKAGKKLVKPNVGVLLQTALSTFFSLSSLLLLTLLLKKPPLHVALQGPNEVTMVLGLLLRLWRKVGRPPGCHGTANTW